MKELLKQAYDLHVHTAPDVVERRYTDLQMAKRICGAGMRGFAIKGHHFNTVARAKIVQELYPECHAVGSVTLNHAVGGLNPAAVEAAGRMGGKIVWFPTSDSYNEKHFLETQGGEKPYGSGGNRDYEAKAIKILEDGKLAGNVRIILELIKKYDMALATGHISSQECLALFRTGYELGLEKMIATHPSFPMTSATLEEQAEYVRYGAVIEHCYYTFHYHKCPYETGFEQIRKVGCSHVILSSDMGQKNSPPPDEGMLDFITKMVEEGGFSQSDVEQMVCKNPAALVE